LGEIVGHDLGDSTDIYQKVGKAHTDWKKIGQIDSEGKETTAEELIEYSMFGNSTSSFGGSITNCVTYDDNLQSIVDEAKNRPATTSFSTGDTLALQAAIDALSENGVLEIQTNDTYGEIILPVTKNIVIRAGQGFNPIFTGNGAMAFLNGAEKQFLIGLHFLNCTTPSSNVKGGCLLYNDNHTITKDIYISDCRFEKSTGSAVLLCYHQDSYTNNYQLNELSENINFLDCDFIRAGTDPVEGAANHLRGFNGVTIRRCFFDAGDGSDVAWGHDGKMRGTNLHACLNIRLQDTKALNSTINGGEGFKFDMLNASTAPFQNTGIVSRCYAENCLEGFDIDDQSDISLTDCIAFNCVEGFVMSKVTGSGGFEKCLAMKCGESFEIGSAVVPENVNLKCNLSVDSTIADFVLKNSMPLDVTNKTGTRDCLYSLFLRTL